MGCTSSHAFCCFVLWRCASRRLFRILHSVATARSRVPVLRTIGYGPPPPCLLFHAVLYSIPCRIIFYSVPYYFHAALYVPAPIGHGPITCRFASIACRFVSMTCRIVFHSMPPVLSSVPLVFCSMRARHQISSRCNKSSPHASSTVPTRAYQIVLNYPMPYHLLLRGRIAV